MFNSWRNTSSINKIWFHQHNLQLLHCCSYGIGPDSSACTQEFFMLLLLPYTEMDSDPDFITGPLCVKLSAFSFIDSKATNISKLRRYISVPRCFVSIHWASNSSTGSSFPRKGGTRVAWLLGKKNPRQIKAIMSERISVKIEAVATSASLLDIRKRMSTFSCGESYSLLQIWDSLWFQWEKSFLSRD